MNKIIVVGGFIEVFEALEENGYSIVGYIDFTKNKRFEKYRWLGTDENIGEIKKKYPNTEIIISPDIPNIRMKLGILYSSQGYFIHSFMSKYAITSASCTLKEGVFIQKLVHISSNTVIGKQVKINVGANIMHDCFIDEYSTIAPNAVLLGHVRIGKNCYIGANATILPNVIIGDNVTVGAGSVVTKNVISGVIVKGNPAK